MSAPLQSLYRKWVDTSEEIVPEPLPASGVQAEPVMPEKPQKAEKTTPQENEKIGQEMQAAMEEQQPAELSVSAGNTVEKRGSKGSRGFQSTFNGNGK